MKSRFRTAINRVNDHNRRSGDSVAESIFQADANTNSAERRKEAALLRYAANPVSEVNLERLIRDSDEVVRALTVRAAGRTNQHAMGIGITREIASDSSPEVRRALAETLKKLDSENKLEIAAQLAGDSDPFVRGAAIETLVNLDREHLEQHLQTGLRDANRYVRNVAVGLLIEFGDARTAQSIRSSIAPQAGRIETWNFNRIVRRATANR